MRLLEEARLVRRGSGEGALDMTELLGLDQILGRAAQLIFTRGPSTEGSERAPHWRRAPCPYRSHPR